MSIQIRSQSTPNPNARKYVVSQDLKASGKVGYSSPNECEHVPLAWALLALPAVNQVHFFENVVTVTQDGNANWKSLDELIQTVLKEEIPYHDIHFDDVRDGGRNRVDRSQLPEEVQKIEAILDRTIRPGLQADGGDLEVVEFSDNVVSIRYEGACGSCPSSLYGTLHAIQSILQDEFDPNVEVAVV